MSSGTKAARANMQFVWDCITGKEERENRAILCAATAAMHQVESRMVAAKIDKICEAIAGTRQVSPEDLQAEVKTVFVHLGMPLEGDRDD